MTTRKRQVVVFILIAWSVENKIGTKRGGPFSLMQSGHVSCRFTPARNRVARAS